MFELREKMNGRIFTAVMGEDKAILVREDGRAEVRYAFSDAAAALSTENKGGEVTGQLVRATLGVMIHRHAERQGN